jgi:hypothetical protein
LNSGQQPVGVFGKGGNASASFSTSCDLADLAISKRDKSNFSSNEERGQDNQARDYC